MIRVEVYGKPDCAPCEEAKAILARLRKELSFDLVEVDVTRDPELERRYRSEVPVVLVDGRKALSLRFTEAEARAGIEGAIAKAAEAAGAAAIPPRTGRRIQVGLGLAALVAVAGALAWKAYDVLVAQPALAEEAFEIVRVAPRAAPDLAVETGDGRTFSLADARGQVVFVNFWATWCPPCREEMPSMVWLGRELARDYPGKFRMVAVSVDEGWDVVHRFFGGAPPPGLLVALDRSQGSTRAYYCAARGGCPADYKFPESYIVDGRGRLVAFVIGPRDWTDPAALRFLRRLID
jgi:thiol-disulfide isomerase/thioredoxin